MNTCAMSQVQWVKPPCQCQDPLNKITQITFYNKLVFNIRHYILQHGTPSSYQNLHGALEWLEFFCFSSFLWNWSQNHLSSKLGLKKQNMDERMCIWGRRRSDTMPWKVSTLTTVVQSYIQHKFYDPSQMAWRQWNSWRPSILHWKTF